MTNNYADLEQFATPKQLKVLKALQSANGVKKRTGIDPSYIRRVLKSLKRQALSRGYSPPHQWNQPTPETHRVKGNSTLYNADGTLDRQWVKSERDSSIASGSSVPEGHTVSKVSTLLDGQGKVRAQWIQAPKDGAIKWSELEHAITRAVRPLAGLADPTTRPSPSGNQSELISLFALGDPHIGMLSWSQETGADFDLKIACRELYAAVDMLTAQAPNGKIAILANLGDFFHAEDDKQLTPRGGNKLDVDSRWGKVAESGIRLMRRMIDRLLEKYEQVRVINVPGNHDPQLSRVLSMIIEAIYEREPRVIVEPNLNPYFYCRYGRTLLGFAHGDGAKMDQLPGIMAADVPQDWGQADYRYWITGHVHHQVKKEYTGCVVESFRTLAPRDMWHHSQGYRSGQSLTAITYDPEFGEISRVTVDIRKVRAVNNT